MTTLRFDITDEQMAVLNTAATEAGYTVYEYVLLRLGFAREAQSVWAKREVIAPQLEDKGATQLERQGSRRAGRSATEQRAG